MKQRETYFEGVKLYPGRMANHHFQGYLAVIFVFTEVVPMMVMGILWTLLYIAYQGLSLVRKKDSAGLDIMDYMVGSLLGLAVCIPIYLGWI